MQHYRFNLGQIVHLRMSDEAGEVVGRAEYSFAAEPSYMVRYQAGDGRMVEQWWTESALEVHNKAG